MKKNLSLFGVAFLVYIIVDIAYNLIIGFKIDRILLENAGILEHYAETPRYPILLLLFFIVIALANVELVIKHALKNNVNIKYAIWGGFLLGITAYATLSFAATWSIKNYPLAFAGIHPLGGGIFCAVTSGITTKIFAKKYGNQ